MNPSRRQSDFYAQAGDRLCLPFVFPRRFDYCFPLCPAGAR